MSARYTPVIVRPYTSSHTVRLGRILGSQMVRARNTYFKELLNPSQIMAARLTTCYG
jgi:hypothetical protein